MKTIYGIFQENKYGAIKVVNTKDEAISYIKEKENEEKGMYLMKKFIAGPREWQQSFWMPCHLEGL